MKTESRFEIVIETFMSLVIRAKNHHVIPRSKLIPCWKFYQKFHKNVKRKQYRSFYRPRFQNEQVDGRKNKLVIFN